MRKSKLARLLAILFTFALIAAACGDSDDSSSEGDSGGGDTTAAPTTSAPDEGGDDTTTSEAPDDTTATTEDMGDDDMAMLADDAVFGNGAAAFEHAVHVGQATPLVAEGDPVTLFLVNLEGSPGGSFPEVREGLEVGLDFVNNVLGGVGADIDNGVPGRPLELDSCPHTLDPAEAQACATESVSANPDIIVKGIDFFSPVLWPVWGGQFPVIDTLPIFVSDFEASSSLAMSGGCVVAFPNAAQMMVEELGHDKIAIIYSDNAPGQQCWQDTQERFYQYYADQGLIEYRGFAEAPGDPADNDAIVQEVINFLDGSNGAVHFGIAAADCAEYNDALDAAGNTHQVYASGSCVDDAVTDAASATGKHFGFTGPPAPSNASLLAQFPEFWQWEVALRDEVLVAGNPESPLSTFMRLGFSTAIMSYEVVSGFIASGGDPSDHAGLQAYMGSLDNQHRIAGAPLDCANKVEDWSAVCDFYQTYFTWDGTEFVPHAGLTHDPRDLTTWSNVQPLLEAVQVAVPRAAG